MSVYSNHCFGQCGIDIPIYACARYVDMRNHLGRCDSIGGVNLTLRSSYESPYRRNVLVSAFGNKKSHFLSMPRRFGDWLIAVQTSSFNQSR